MKSKLLPKWQIRTDQVHSDSAPLGLKHLTASPAIPGHPRGWGAVSSQPGPSPTPAPFPHPQSPCSIQSGISFRLRTAPGFTVFLNPGNKYLQNSSGSGALLAPGAAVSKQENTPAFSELGSHAGGTQESNSCGSDGGGAS